MRYHLENADIYLFTTEGMKTHDIDANPEICLQVEEIHDPLHWRSVIVNGRADRLTEQSDIDHARQFIKERNPPFHLQSISLELTHGDAQKSWQSIASIQVR
jgi:nitroimidazol reductase NimA-like FMN-containing flavoprotein (pyridoxamine 5'-phosphate oxidase superfamily)